MINEFKKIMMKPESLPDHNQVAALLTEELKWEESFKISQDQLSILAEAASIAYEEGKTISFDDL